MNKAQAAPPTPGFVFDFLVTLTRIALRSKGAKFSQFLWEGRVRLVTVTFESQGYGRRKLLHILNSPRFIPWGAFLFLRQGAKPHREQT